MPDTFPITDVSLLLDMVRGTTPFNLVVALKATLNIATYAVGLFDAKSLPVSETPDFSLEECLMLLKACGTGAHTEAVNSGLWQLVIQMVLEWLSQKAATGQS